MGAVGEGGEAGEAGGKVSDGCRVVLRQMPRDKDVLRAKEAARLKNPRASAYVAWNLQYLPAAVNTSKSNKRPPPGYLDWAGQHDNEPLRAAVAGEWGGFGEEYYD
jgi:hypothetical protein